MGCLDFLFKIVLFVLMIGVAIITFPVWGTLLGVAALGVLATFWVPLVLLAVVVIMLKMLGII